MKLQIMACQTIGENINDLSLGVNARSQDILATLCKAQEKGSVLLR